MGLFSPAVRHRPGEAVPPVGTARGDAVGVVSDAGAARVSDLTTSEKRKLERLFEMGGGHALDFSHRTLREFIEEHTGRDVYAPDYPQRGSGSKAWKLRTFWEVEPNHLCGKLVTALIEHRAELLDERERRGATLIDVTRQPDEDRLVEECRRIAARLSQGGAVAEIGAIAAPVPEPDFEAVAREVQEVIRRNQPEAGLDRLHTFVVKFVRSLATQRGITVTRETALHGLFGEYVKKLRSEGLIESRMTDRLLKSSISTLEGLNEVRNERSLAHDNPMLNYEESLLIFNHVAATVRFIKALEGKLARAATPESPPSDDDLPF